MNISDLKRTYQTNVSDEELLILDVLFDARDTFESLAKENYATWHNLPYSHNLEVGDLTNLINRLLGDGIISFHTSNPGNKVFYGLTEAGGKAWEVERVPDWERYCTDYSTVNEAGHWMLFVESPSLATAKAFMDCATHCHLYQFNPNAIRISTIIEEKSSTIYWKAFPTAYSMSVTTYPLAETNRVDWNEYESRRSWWRTLTELAKFQLL